jgi:hypothetical protein
MSEGIYLRCSPSDDWTIGVYDANWVQIRQLVAPVPTMEEAMRRFSTLAGNSIFMRLTDPQLGQTRGDLYPLSLLPR